jgi:hypothetical protein
MLHAAIPIVTITNDIDRYPLASTSWFSEKLFPRKRWIPVGTPRVARVETMDARETTADEIPIASGVVIFDIKNQKKYPANMEISDSTNR